MTGLIRFSYSQSQVLEIKKTLLLFLEVGILHGEFRLNDFTSKNNKIGICVALSE